MSFETIEKSATSRETLQTTSNTSNSIVRIYLDYRYDDALTGILIPRQSDRPRLGGNGMQGMEGTPYP